MGCSQSKYADVLASNTQKKELVELKTTEEEQETEASKKHDKEPVDEAPMTLEPVAPVIDMLAMEQVPDSSAVDVPDSVRANFSSFNISFIDPTVSAPTSATTEPNVASTRVTVISGPLREDVADKEMEPDVSTKTEEGAAEQIEVEVVKKVEELVVTTEEPIATIERVNETVETEMVVEPVAAALKEETIAEEQEVEAASVNPVATVEIVEKSRAGKTVEEVIEEASTEVKDVVAAVAELVATSKKADADVEQPAAATEVIESVKVLTDVQPIVKYVPESIQEEQIAEPVEEEYVAEVVVEKLFEPVVANMADSVNEEEISEPVKKDNKVVESVVVVSKKVADEVLQKNAEPVLGEKIHDSIKETRDIDSVMPAEVAAIGGDAIPHEESDVADNAIADAKETVTVIEEHVAVETSNQIEAVAEMRSTGMNKSDSSAASEDGIEAEDSGVERPSIIDEHSMLEKNKEAESLTSAKKPVASH